MTICLNTYTPNRYLGHASFEAQITPGSEYDQHGERGLRMYSRQL